MTAEARLVAACTKLQTTGADKVTIRTLLAGEIDWTAFARMLVERGLASHAGHVLLRDVPELLPDDISDALRAVVDQTRAANGSLLAQLARTIEAMPPASAVERIRHAHAAADAALAANPNDSAAWRTLGQAFAALKKLEKAIACYSRALELAPGDALNWRERAGAMLAIGQLKAALSDIDRALAFDPQDARTWTFRARTLVTATRFAEAVEASDRALALDPGNTAAERAGIQSRLFVCDWSRRESDKRRIAEGMKKGRTLITPVHHRAISDSEEEQFVLVRLRAKPFLTSAQALWRGERYQHKKIRIAYLSTDFRRHAVAGRDCGLLRTSRYDMFRNYRDFAGTG